MCPRLLWLLSPRKWKPSTLGLCHVAVDMQGYEGIDAECIWAFVCLFISLWWSLIPETSGAILGGDTKELGETDRSFLESQGRLCLVGGSVHLPVPALLQKG